MAPTVDDWRRLGKGAERYVVPEEDFNGMKPSIGKSCFMVFSGTLYDRIMTSSCVPIFPNTLWPFTRMPLATTEQGVAVHFPLYGSSRAASAVEQLAFCGVETTVGLGLCGSIASHLEIGAMGT